METNCPTCPNENLTDFPVCPTCATTRHFEYRNDCRCAPCQVERAEMSAAELARLESIAFNEELQFIHGRPIAAAA